MTPSADRRTLDRGLCDTSRMPRASASADDAQLLERVSAEEVAESALAWAYESLRCFAPSGVGPEDEGFEFRRILRRLGGRFADVAADLEEMESLRLAVLDRARGRDFREKDPARLERISDRRAMDALRPLVYQRDGFRCLACGATEKLTLDHILPYSRGGRATYENLQTLCQSCNSRKGTSLP